MVGDACGGAVESACAASDGAATTSLPPPVAHLALVALLLVVAGMLAVRLGMQRLRNAETSGPWAQRCSIVLRLFISTAAAGLGLAELVPVAMVSAEGSRQAGSINTRTVPEVLHGTSAAHLLLHLRTTPKAWPAYA